MSELSVNGEHRPQATASADALARALTRLIEDEPEVELWLCHPDGASVCMLRSGPHAWLMHLRFDGDSGFTSEGDPQQDGMVHYSLGNGQVDQYPLSWCIDLAQCREALLHFFTHQGERDPRVKWTES